MLTPLTSKRIPYQFCIAKIRWSSTCSDRHTSSHTSDEVLGVLAKHSEHTRTNSVQSPSPKRSRRSIPPRQIDADLADAPSIAVFRHPDTIPMSIGNAQVVQDSVKYIGSYNWIDSLKPTIIVPGSPRVWRAGELPYSVPQHYGGAFIDENGHRMGPRALLPLLAAVDIAAAQRGQPQYDWSSVDLVTDRGNLRRLLMFLRGKKDSFRIDIQLAGKRTLLFTRWEKRTESHCWQRARCFAHSFEVERTIQPATCEHDIKGHHRIISYEFDDLRVVVRSEIDAYHPDTAPAIDLSSSETSLVKHTLSTTTHPIRANTSVPPVLVSQHDYRSLCIVYGGEFVEQRHLVELKTSSRKSSISWPRVLPQLYLSQTHHIIVAVHRNGTFHRLRTETLHSEHARRRQQLQERDYARLGPLLRAVRDVIIVRGHQARLSLVFSKQRGLEIRERKSTRSCLPEHILHRFDSTHD